MDKLDSNLHLFLQSEGLEDTGIRMPGQQAQFSESSLECEEPGGDTSLIGAPNGKGGI